MTKVKIATEKLWAKNKYDIMAKGYEKYSEIKTMFKEANSIDDYYKIYRKLKTFRELPYTKKSVKNTLEHIWGYFKRKASREEKEQFFLLLEGQEKLQIETFMNMPNEVQCSIAYSNHLLGKYNEAYLQNSTFLFPQLVWNEVRMKKEVFVIDDQFYLSEIHSN